MGKRIQVVLSDEEREAFRRQARREGKTLSSWLREAGLDRLRGADDREIADVDDLRAFFEALPDRDSAQAEPDWSEHVRVIESSRGEGQTTT